jgi:hypothetical protein
VRLGDSHGLLRALDARGRMRVDEFATECAADELYPPGLEDAWPRTRQFLAYARAAELIEDDRGILELSDAGRRYIRAGSADRPFDVVPAQAEVLRGLLRERHAADGVYRRLATALRDGTDAADLTLLRDMELVRDDGTLTAAGEQMAAATG